MGGRKVDFREGGVVGRVMGVMSCVEGERGEVEVLVVMGVDECVGGVVGVNGRVYGGFGVG